MPWLFRAIDSENIVNFTIDDALYDKVKKLEKLPTMIFPNQPGEDYSVEVSLENAIHISQDTYEQIKEFINVGVSKRYVEKMSGYYISSHFPDGGFLSNGPNRILVIGNRKPTEKEIMKSFTYISYATTLAGKMIYPFFEWLEPLDFETEFDKDEKSKIFEYSPTKKKFVRVYPFHEARFENGAILLNDNSIILLNKQSRQSTKKYFNDLVAQELEPKFISKEDAIKLFDDYERLTWDYLEESFGGELETKWDQESNELFLYRVPIKEVLFLNNNKVDVKMTNFINNEMKEHRIYMKNRKK